MNDKDLEEMFDFLIKGWEEKIKEARRHLVELTQMKTEELEWTKKNNIDIVRN